MVCYYVFVRLLLRLSNDIEENPGSVNITEIVDPTYTVRADFNQGSQSLFELNAGKQCVAMSIYAILYNEIKSVNIWDTSIMNTVLANGNNLYSIISQHVKDFLLLTQVLEVVSIDNSIFYLDFTDSFSGALLLDENINAHVTLEHSFHQIFDIDNCKACLLTIDANVVAVFMPFPDVFKIFYSHSLNMHGLPCEHGYSVLLSVEGVQNLVKYFRLFRNHHRNNFGSLFELRGVKCNSNNKSDKKKGFETK